MGTALPVVALVGRTNVGKSSLFNRLIERKTALVSREPGTTRDRRSETVRWRGIPFHLTDTGGLDTPRAAPLQQKILAQTAAAWADAQVIVLVCDATTGVLPEDRAQARLLRRERKPVILAINKVHKPNSTDLGPFRKLGLTPAIPVSALTGVGTGDLLDAMVERIPKGEEEEVERRFRVAIVGKPNVGKSSLLNALVGKERVIADAEPGTTREPQDITFSYRGVPFVLTDTAGIRRQGQRGERLEALGVRESLRALRTSDLCLFVLDASQPLTRQDRHLAGRIVEARVSTVIVANKWDRVSLTDAEGVTKVLSALRPSLASMPWAPIIPFSALKRKPLPRLLDALLAVRRAYCLRLSVDDGAAVLAEIPRRMPRGKERVGWSLKQLEQVRTAPPEFRVTIAGKTPIPEALPYIVERTLRSRFPLEGTPIRVTFQRMA